MDHVNGLVHGDHGQLFHLGQQQLHGVEGGEDATVIHSLQQLLLAGSS